MTTLRVALPRAAAITDVLVAPPDGELGETEISRIRDRIVYGRPLAARATLGDPVRVDAYLISMYLADPERLQRLDRSFSPTPASCRRTIGLAAVLMCLRDPSLAPGSAVKTLLSDAGTPSVSGTWWEEWYRKQPRAARSVVAAEAVTWATHLFEALEWHRFDPPARLAADIRWQTTGPSPIAIHGKVDVQVSTGGRPSFFTINTGIAGPHWAAALSLPALAAGLGRGPVGVPARVVGLWPESGQVRILAVEPGILDRTSRLVIETARVVRNLRRSS
jgi:hypothetical protein